ncbi:IS5 family transposase [Streptomyces olivaceus]|uniref:IS5 family transposase n=1 Tax=Streptomyces olivaceus TaxID=47716 RepID=UPI003558AFC4
MLDAVRYLVDNGIKWRSVPCDFPPWDRVYAFFRRWRDHVLVREFHDRLRGPVREHAGRDAEPSAGVIDSQSVKADAVAGADNRGFDGRKLINGRKRHVVVDTLGLLLGVMVTSADIGDRAAAKVVLARVADAHHWLELVWADGGYTGSLAEHCLATLALVLAIVKRSDDTRGFVVLPKRWIVERLFAHLMRSRRLARHFERRTTSAEAMVYWSMTTGGDACTPVSVPAPAGRSVTTASAGLPPGADSTAPTRSREIVYSSHSCSAVASSAWIRSASSRCPSTRRRAASSCCSSSPTTDGIRDLHGSDETTVHHSQTDATPTPDHRKLSRQTRKDTRSVSWSPYGLLISSETLRRRWRISTPE